MNKLKVRKGIIFINFLIFLPVFCKAQNIKDSVTNKAGWSFHFQQTVIPQYHPSFSAAYSDTFSLQTAQETQVSLTTSFFLGRRLWKNGEFFFNPELAGGSGLSQARGIAGFANGETFRIGNPKPQIYLARLFFRQVIPLSKDYVYYEDVANVIAGKKPVSYLAFSIGKFSIADFFDQNKYSHDPRSQFLNWSLMSNGGWDYPANTRGYTLGYTIELVKPLWAVRVSTVMVPKQANGNVLDPSIGKAHSSTIEYSGNFKIRNKAGIVRLLGFYTNASMGNYKIAIATSDGGLPDITRSRLQGRTKYGIGLNIEQDLSDNSGIFMRVSWNDGKNETWAFTEIDRSISAGAVIKGASWKRSEDVIGLAIVGNRLSDDHKEYLMHGGHGFMLGDGKLNYGTELIAEVYYNLRLHEQHFWVSPDYQFVLNPGYNKDRGPVHIIGCRFHVEF